MAGLRSMKLSLCLTFLLARMAFGAETSYSSECDTHDADPSVFVLGEYFDYDTFVVLLSIVGGCAIVFELVLSRYETWLKSEGDSFQSTLYEKIVAELMTLGVVSFALYLLQPVVPKGDLFLVFEFSHYVIFFIAIFTVLQLVVLGASTYPIKRRWDDAAFKSKEELLEGYRANVVHKRKCSIPMFGLGRVSLDVSHWRANWRWIDAVYYHIARSVFIRQHNRAANFDFARYATLVTDRQILGMANISHSSWLALLVFRWVWYGFQQAFSKEDNTVSYLEWFVFGVVLCLLELSLLFACMLGVRRVCVKLGADPKDPVKTLDAVLERIWVAPVTHMQHAASMHVVSEEAMAALGEDSVRDSPANSTAVGAAAPGSSSFATAAAGAAAVHGSEGGGGLEAGGAVAAVSTLGVEGMEMEAGGGEGIPKITMRDAFLLGSGKAYRRAVDILMLLNSYYLAFYTVYLISHASKSSTEWVWIIVLPLPILCGVLMAYRRVLPLIALLSTIVMVQPTDVADVEQEAEEINRVRRKLVMRVEEVLEQEFKACAEKDNSCLEGQSSAAYLLKRWDEDDNGTLSYKELEKGLNEIGLVLSSKQRRELLRLADPDRSGSVDIKELTELFYDVKIEMDAAAEVAGESSSSAAAAAAGRRGVPSAGSMRHTISGGGDRPNLSGGGGGGRGGGSANERVERLLRRRASEKWG
eukprot:g4726.t1